MNKSGWGKKLLLAVVLLVVIGLLAVFFYGKYYFKVRGHGDVTYQAEPFVESNRSLQNPNRGFYYIHGFWITEEETDFKENVTNRFQNDRDTTLAMIQINLQTFRDGEISQQGLANIEDLFEELEQIDKNYIVRFLYDWDGQNLEREPENIDIILRHMEQVAPIVNKHKSRIYLMQGLFIGNWGEMNGTKYSSSEDVQTLANKLAEVTDEDIFLSVRMPMFWRQITRIADLTEEELETSPLALRLGLYNDGIMGNEYDYGTYGNQTRAVNGDYTYWNREEELAFQEILCGKVPNGGEVIVENPYNDLDNAIVDLGTMHISYLNRDYDRNVLNKWAAGQISEESRFAGMDGLSYVEQRLGYRFYIHQARFQYDFKKDKITTSVDFKNAGFAPIYKETDVTLMLYYKNSGTWEEYPMEGNIYNLSGGNDTQLRETYECQIDLAGAKPEQVEVYVKMTDAQTGEQILLANEQEATETGYQVGTLQIETVEQLWENWKQQHLN